MQGQRKTLACNLLQNKGLFIEAGKIRTSDPQIRNLMLNVSFLTPLLLSCTELSRNDGVIGIRPRLPEVRLRAALLRTQSYRSVRLTLGFKPNQWCLNRKGQENLTLSVYRRDWV